jgi:nitrogen regulatory protein P-II 1
MTPIGGALDEVHRSDYPAFQVGGREGSAEQSGVFRLTVSDVKGLGRQKGHTEVYRGHEYEVKLNNKVKLEIAVDDEFVQTTVDAIVQSGRTGSAGKIGDGKVFLLPLEEAVRIRTGERGRDAI